MEMEVLLIFETLYTKETDPSPENVALLSQELFTSELLFILIEYMAKLDFEAKKDVSMIFCSLLRRQVGSRFPCAGTSLTHL